MEVSLFSVMNTATPQLTTVHLVGSLGKAIGREVWHLDVNSVSEALRAIDINTRGALANYLRGPAAKRAYKIALQKKSNIIEPKEGTHRSGRSTIYIMPTIRGRNSGGGKIALGIGLIALAVFTGGASAGVTGWAWSAGAAATATTAGTAAGLTTFGSLVVGFGISLVLGGITQLLTPKAQGPADPNEQSQSTSFSGNTSAVVQGGCIGVVYGRALVTPIPVSITTDNDDLSTTSAGDEQAVEVTDLEGGGQQFSSAG